MTPYEVESAKTG